MSPEFRIPLDIAQLIMLAALVWGLAKMSKSVDVLGTVTDKLTRGLEAIDDTLNGLVTRVSILEDRGGRRRFTDPAP